MVRGARTLRFDPNADLEWVRAQSEIAARLGETVLAEPVISGFGGQVQFVGRLNPNDAASARNVRLRLQILDETATQNLGASEGGALTH